MGAWDASSFGNDTANDWAYSLEESGDGGFIEETLQRVLNSADEYLEAPEAEEAIAAAEVVAWLLGRRGALHAYTEKIAVWVENHPIKPSATLVKAAVAALDRIQGPNSELAELWEGQEEWTRAVNDLRHRLRGAR